MRSGSMMCIVLLSSFLIAGCIQLPGIRSISDTPDPVIGQWIGGEPPESDIHVVFYDNGTFLSRNFFIRRGEETDTGTWSKIGRGHYATQSVTGEITNWTYDSWEDSVSVSKIPQMKYYRYKG